MHKRTRYLLSSVLIVLVGLTTVTSSAVEVQSHSSHSRLTWDNGAIVRGDLSQKRIALIFTGGDYGEGTSLILDTLHRLDVKAGLFVTGAYIRQSKRAEQIRRAVREGHYVGPHSDQHLLYCSWEDRNKTLVTRQQFESDLQRNVNDLKALGALSAGQVYFIPPYEWYNSDQAEWARQMDVQMFNFSPGSGSNRDYMPESDPRFVPSEKILQGILDYEKKDANGLNGYILLLHLGADRKDKMFYHVERLVMALKQRGYEFVRIDHMLSE
ncbi:MAG TPA: polysaccharide deacetylase family protein [Terriglobales bacterium]|nr:polysaccharide deacetylase family protein [Terriglobales bacterium]